MSEKHKKAKSKRDFKDMAVIGILCAVSMVAISQLKTDPSHFDYATPGKLMGIEQVVNSDYKPKKITPAMIKAHREKILQTKIENERIKKYNKLHPNELGMVPIPKPAPLLGVKIKK